MFYHTVLKCYILVDLLVGKLTHEDIGQLQLYVNYFDAHRRTPGEVTSSWDSGSPSSERLPLQRQWS